MKRFALLLAAVAPLAFGAGVVQVTDNPVHLLYKGAQWVGQYPTHDACVQAATKYQLNVLYECRPTTNVLVQLVAGPQPPDETQNVACPAGSAQGSVWVQTRTYIAAPSPVFWKATPWMPLAPGPSACPPPPPPPTMHVGWAVDDTSVDFTVHPGSSDRLIDPEGVDCKTAADAVPGCNWPGLSGDGTGAFRNVAFPSTMGYFDPIVHPGEANTSHLHQFIGNTSINKDSTGDTLIANCNSTFRGGAVSCSAVWAPVFVDTKDNTIRRARNFIVYYKKAAWSDPKQVQPIPIGLKMVIGNPSAMSYTQWGIAGFSCDGNKVADDSDPFTGGSHVVPTLAQCGVGHGVWMGVVAPNCWDGKNLYLPDNSHVAYAPSPFPPNILSNGCMPDHPILIPQVAVLTITDVGPNDDPGRWVLSSDHAMTPMAGDTDQVMALPGGKVVKRGASAHADYFGAIPLDIQQKFLDGCIRPSLDCGASLMGDGHSMRSFGGN